MLVQMFTLPFSIPTYGMEESVFFLFQNQKIIPINSHEHQIKDKQTFFQTDFFFSKANEKGANLFS